MTRIISSPQRDILPLAGGYEMETLPGFGLAGVATNTIPGAWGAEYAKVIEMYDHFAGMWLVGEDLPQASNGVTLRATEKDQHGMPIPVVHFKDHPNDIAMRNHAYKAGHPLSLCNALHFNALSSVHRRVLASVLKFTEESLQVAGEHGFPQYLAMATFLRGWALAQLGVVDDGIELGRQGPS
jgi:hypothetical protein